MPYQLDLFNEQPIDTEPFASAKIVNDLTELPDLFYQEDYLSPTEHNALWSQINEAHNWIIDLKRRVQHYGYRYDYKARQVNLAMRVGPLPLWLQQLAQRLHDDGHIAVVPDQVIVNEYTPGQGIADHIDCEPCFGDTIISLSLGSGCIMNFTRKTDDYRIPVWLEPRSIVVLKGAARNTWKHGIPPRKTDEVNGQKFERTTRISLTFRKVILQNPSDLSAPTSAGRRLK